MSLGFESGCPQVLRAMNKRFQPEEVREISERLAAHGIRRMGFLLLGGPGETKESVEESLAFARSLGLEMLKVSVGIRLYPHTPLARQAVEEGVVSPEDDLLVPRFYIRPGLEDYCASRYATARDGRVSRDRRDSRLYIHYKGRLYERTAFHSKDVVQGDPGHFGTGGHNRFGEPTPNRRPHPGQRDGRDHFHGEPGLPRCLS